MMYVNSGFDEKHQSHNTVVSENRIVERWPELDRFRSVQAHGDHRQKTCQSHQLLQNIVLQNLRGLPANGTRLEVDDLGEGDHRLSTPLPLRAVRLAVRRQRRLAPRQH